MIPVDYIDGAGRKRRSLIPDGSGIPGEEGIPLSLDLDDLYPEAPEAFLTQLHNELWSRGLIEARDFLRPGAPEDFKRAVLGVIRLDFTRVKQIASEDINNGNGY